MNTTYQLSGRAGTARALLTPLALLELLPAEERPNRVIALCTAGARQSTWNTFADGVREVLGIEAEPLDVPDGRTTDQIRRIIESAAEPFAEGDRLTLDVTQGLRHFPFVAYALALYLTSLKGIRLQGAYYGMLEGAQDVNAPRPIIDLSPLLELPEWFHAVRVFRDTGSTDPLTAIVGQLADKLRAEAQSAAEPRPLYKLASVTATMRDRLRQLTFAYESGMPLELGKSSMLLDESIRQLPEAITGRLLLAANLATFVQSALVPFRFGQRPAGKGEWKGRIALDRTELERQAVLIERYLERGQLPLAMGLLREWVVSWLMDRLGQADRWWDRPPRLQAERRLGALSAAVAGPLRDVLGAEQRRWGEFWTDLSKLRNTLHHHGMRLEALDPARLKVDRLLEFWSLVRAGRVPLPALGGGEGSLLVSPVGSRPGVLYSALVLAQPDHVLVVCSRESAPMVNQAAARAGFSGPIESIIVTDPHGGFDEINRVCAAAEQQLLGADRVLANLTGGTTLMGLMVQQLVEAGCRLSRPARRFALIDRRAPHEQDAAPWVRSDAHWLDPPDTEGPESD